MHTAEIEIRFKKITGFYPNPMQIDMFQRLLKYDIGLLLKSPTGSGKTEAVIAPSIFKEYRLFMIYPATSLIDDQAKRLKNILQKLSERNKEYSLIVDTGAISERTVFRNGDALPTGKRHLYKADLILTTLDKFLYRFFGYGEPKKSYIFPFRIHNVLKKTLFCFDEAHSYDGVAFTNFAKLIRSLYEVDLNLVVMTATMPESYLKSLDFLEVVDYSTGNNYYELEVFYPKEFPDRTIQYIKLEASNDNENYEKALISQISTLIENEYSSSKKIIATLESVKNAANLYTSLESKFKNIFLYHGRLPNERRRFVYDEIKKREENKEGYLLITTSAIEVGCDLDSHILITELCNPEQLIQRAGRCNRKGIIPNARVIVVGNNIRDYIRTIPIEKEEEYKNWLLENTLFNSNELANFISKDPLFDYRIEIMFNMLYEYVYESVIENKPLHDKGLVITRSWEPSVTLTTNAKSPYNLENAVTVPITRFVEYNKDKDLDLECKILTINNGQITELNSGYYCAYFKDLFVEIPRERYDPKLGYVDIPKVFHRKGKYGYKKMVGTSETEGKLTLWYIEPEVEIL